MPSTHLSRRKFMQLAGAASTSVFLPVTYSTGSLGRLTDQLGLQLYSVRDILSEKPQETLEAIRSAGYRQVELFDSQLLPRLQPVLKSLGITVSSTHFLSPLLTGNWEPMTAFGTVPPPADYTINRVVEQAAEYEVKYLIFPYLYPQDRGGLDRYRSLAEQLNETGELCKSFGVQFGYHNHSFEYQPMEDSSPMEVLLAETNPELVSLELDVFWVSVAGYDPASYITEHADRIQLLHLKDKKGGVADTYKAVTMAPDSFQPVGNGVLDFPGILAAAEAANVQYVFVEQDYSDDPLADIKKSSDYLLKL